MIFKAFDSLGHITLLHVVDKLDVGEPLLFWFGFSMYGCYRQCGIQVNVNRNYKHLI